MFTNKWIWAPNEIYHEKQVPYSDDILAFYPGDAYVDWVGLSSFNWANTYKQNVWADPKDLYTETVSILRTLNKPMLIAETASADADKKGTQKAEWIEKLAVYMKENNDIKGVMWFNTVDNGVDWSLQSTLASIASFKASFDDYFSTQLTSTPSDCC